MADETEVVEMTDGGEESKSMSVKRSLIGTILSHLVINIQITLVSMRPAWGNPRVLRLQSVGKKIVRSRFFVNEVDTGLALGDRHRW